MRALADFFVVLDDDTAADLVAILERRREERTRDHRERVEELDVASN